MMCIKYSNKHEEDSAGVESQQEGRVVGKREIGID
jgi:hypothetical protein